MTPQTNREVRRCEDCGVSEAHEMLAGRDGRLICGDCDDAAEARWVAEDPENNRHYLDTFSPGGF